MEQFWRRKSFKVLLTTWNRKLKSSGFDDIEQESKTGEERVLKQRSARKCFSQADDFEREMTLEYYLLLGHLVQNTIFPNDLEQSVMIRHSEGAKVTEIVDEISSKGIRRHKDTVMHIIRRWQTKWGIRKWSLKEMRLKKDIG